MESKNQKTCYKKMTTNVYDENREKNNQKKYSLKKSKQKQDEIKMREKFKLQKSKSRFNQP